MSKNILDDVPEVESERIVVRLKPMLKEKLMARCATLGLTVSDVMRFFCMSWIEGGLTIHARLPDDLRKASGVDEAGEIFGGHADEKPPTKGHSGSGEVGKRTGKTSGSNRGGEVDSGGSDLYSE